MTDDLLDQVRAALREWDEGREDNQWLEAGHPDIDENAIDWLRALVERCEKAEARVRELETIINNLDPRR